MARYKHDMDYEKACRLAPHFEAIEENAIYIKTPPFDSELWKMAKSDTDEIHRSPLFSDSYPSLYYEFPIQGSKVVARCSVAIEGQMGTNQRGFIEMKVTTADVEHLIELAKALNPEERSKLKIWINKGLALGEKELMEARKLVGEYERIIQGLHKVLAEGLHKVLAV